MRLHRFYVSPELTALDHTIWIRDERLRNQWLKVLRYREGDQVVLFDSVAQERLYKFIQVEQDAIKLELVTEFERKFPAKHVYLFFSLLKKDKNDWVLQKCTELGVRNFVPILAERSVKTGFNLERAEKIVIEAAEQCGRSDIPHIRDPVLIEIALAEYKNKATLFVAEESLEFRGSSTEVGGKKDPLNSKLETRDSEIPIGVFIGPEGGWTDTELALFKEADAGHFHLGNLTLRAETAAVAAVTKLSYIL